MSTDPVYAKLCQNWKSPRDWPVGSECITVHLKVQPDCTFRAILTKTIRLRNRSRHVPAADVEFLRCHLPADISNVKYHRPRQAMSMAIAKHITYIARIPKPSHGQGERLFNQ